MQLRITYVLLIELYVFTYNIVRFYKKEISRVYNLNLISVCVCQSILLTTTFNSLKSLKSLI